MLNIKNNKIRMFIETYFNKKLVDINDEDLKKIKTFNFSCSSEEHETDFDLLSSLENVEELYVEGYELTQDDLDKLFSCGCRSITFKRCLFDKSLNLNNKLSELHLLGCFVDNYDSVILSNPNMENLEINKPFDEGEIDCSLLPCRLKKLTLNYCVLTNADCLSKLNECSYLSVLGTGFDETGLDFLTNMTSLKKLYIEKRYLNSSQVSSIKSSCDVKSDYKELLYDNDIEDDDTKVIF